MLKLENLREGEVVQFVIKRHWIIYALLGLYILFWVITVLWVYLVLWFSAFATFINVLFLLVFLLFLYVSWLNHELDMYIITNNRIVWVDQLSFLNRTVSECSLWQVQEVNSKSKGFFSNIFNYGTLYIQTAGNKITMQMSFCPDSINQARKVLNIVDAYRED